MCNLSKGVREKGRAEYITEGTLVSIKDLVKNTGVSVLEVPDGGRKKYIGLLKKK